MDTEPEDPTLYAFRPLRVGGIVITYPCARWEDYSELRFILRDEIVLLTRGDRCVERDQGRARFRFYHHFIMDALRRRGVDTAKVNKRVWRKTSGHLREWRRDTDPRYFPQMMDMPH